MTDRDRYLAALFTDALAPADAVVVLAGEDARPRMAVALQVLAQRGAEEIVLSGGVDDPPGRLGARSLYPLLIGQGVAPGRVVVEAESRNTRDQAVALVELARLRDWHRILVVASPYHTPRAHLTFVRAANEAGLADSLHVLMVPASQTRWFEAPDGAGVTRMDRFGGELAKIDEYADHVATYAEGLAYLKHWERAR